MLISGLLGIFGLLIISLEYFTFFYLELACVNIFISRKEKGGIRRNEGTNNIDDSTDDCNHPLRLLTDDNDQFSHPSYNTI